MKLATIERIKGFEPIPNKDFIHLASMEGNGWKCVCKKSELGIVGELAAFFVIDSIVDDKNPAFDFLQTQRYRIRNAKFGGVASQGLLVPLSVLSFYGIDISTLKEGDDITEITKTTHYEKPLPNNLDAKGNFPSGIISMTDEDNIKSNIAVLPEFEGEKVVITMKMDGSSSIYIYNIDNEFYVCSRRLALKDGQNGWWEMVHKYDLENKIKNLGYHVAIQAELCGPKFNGGKLGLKENDLFVFNIKNLDNGHWYGQEEIQYFCEDLGIKAVPVIKECDWSEVGGLEGLQKIANEVKYPNGQMGEGCVMRPSIPKMSNYLGKWLSVKMINQFYKD